FAHEDLITHLLKVKLPFEPSALAEAAGIAALDDKEWLHRTLELNARMLRMLSEELPRIGLAVVPSKANFVMAPLANSEEAARLVEELLQRGVIVRPLGTFELPRCVRISTGTEEEIASLLEALRHIY